MNLINFQLVTPERVVLKKELTSLTVPTSMGEITILPNHVALVATLVPGELKAKSGKEEFYVSIAGGFLQINPGNQVTILADAAEHYFEINLQRAQEAKERAEKQLLEVKQNAEEYAKVAAALEKSLTRMKIARKHSHRKNPITGEGVFFQ